MGVSTMGADDLGRTPRPRSSISRFKLVLLFALFALPLLAAWIFHLHPGWVPKGTTNHGTLVQPARPLSLNGLVGLHGKPLPGKYLQGRWTLLYIGGDTCGRVCRTKLYDLHQILIATGNNAHRVQRLYVRTSALDPRHVQDLEQAHPRLRVAIARPGGAFLRQFHFGEGKSPASAQRLYIVDPHGNLMMRYAPGASPHGMLKDLQHLLRVSQIG